VPDPEPSPLGRPQAPAQGVRSGGVLLVLGGALFWSTSGVFLKLLTLPPLQIAAVRALIAGLALAPFLPRMAWRWDWRLPPLVLGYTATVLLFNLSIRATTAANAIALVYTAPIWVFGLTLLTQRRGLWREAVPVAVVAVGLAVLLAEPARGTSLQGNLMGMGAGLGFGVFTFLIARMPQPGISLVSLCNLAAAALLAALQPGVLNLAPLAAREWLILAFLGVFQIALGHVLFTAGLRRIPATQASILALAEPVLNPLWVFLFVGEVPSRYGLAGLAIILGGVLADFLARRRAPSRGG